MAETTFPPSPGWVTSGSKDVSGLDLLALRTPVQRIGNALLDGVTTITPSIRYLAFNCWITKLYWEAGGKDDWTAFQAHARRIEAAIAIGNLLGNPGATGLIGGNYARDQIEGEGNVTLDITVKQLAVTAYANPASQLGLMAWSADAAVPHLTEERGVPLAEAIAALAAQSPLSATIQRGAVPESASKADLIRFGEIFAIDRVSDAEQALLTKALLPDEPRRPAERMRIGTYVAILTEHQQANGPVPNRAHLDRAVLADRAHPATMDAVFDGWLMYLVRDLLAVAHEIVMQSVVAAMPEGEGIAETVAVDEVLQTLVGSATDADPLLRELKLIEGDGPWQRQPFSELSRRVETATSKDLLERRGLRFWASGITEQQLMDAIQAAGPSCIVLLPVAWLLAERRAGPGVKAGVPDFDCLSEQGHSRIGLSQVVVPTLSDLRHEDPSLDEVVARLVVLTVDQHLRTAWSRLAIDASRDVSILTADGTHWIRRKGFHAGQTAARLRQAVGWLRQLRLIDDGLTPEGETALASARIAYDREH